MTKSKIKVQSYSSALQTDGESVTVCLGAFNSPSRTHLLENECPPERSMERRRNVGAQVDAFRPSPKGNRIDKVADSQHSADACMLAGRTLLDLDENKAWKLVR